MGSYPKKMVALIQRNVGFFKKEKRNENLESKVDVCFEMMIAKGAG
jgi:hypothetical protein